LLGEASLSLARGAKLVGQVLLSFLTSMLLFSRCPLASCALARSPPSCVVRCWPPSAPPLETRVFSPSCRGQSWVVHEGLDWVVVHSDACFGGPLQKGCGLLRTPALRMDLVGIWVRMVSYCCTFADHSHAQSHVVALLGATTVHPCHGEHSASMSLLHHCLRRDGAEQSARHDGTVLTSPEVREVI